MRLTILGASASYPGAGQACAGYLIQAGGSAILLDCGNGTLANLGGIIDPLSLDAVFITHDHVDHFADIYALQALVRYAPDGPAAPLDIYVPEGLFERMGLLLSERGRQEFAEAFCVHTLRDGVALSLRTTTVTPCAVDHSEPTFALRVEHQGATMCYTSDSAPGDRVNAAAQGATLLLAEATLPQQYAGRAPHLTAREAGELANQATAGRLVLTHVWPTNDRAEMESEASSAFSGPVDIARELDCYDIPALAVGRGE